MLTLSTFLPIAGRLAIVQHPTGYCLAALHTTHPHRRAEWETRLSPNFISAQGALLFAQQLVGLLKCHIPIWTLLHRLGSRFRTPTVFVPYLYLDPDVSPSSTHSLTHS